MATATAYDAITLDVMLPGTDGFTLCRDFRRLGVSTPVLMITALDTIHDRVTGLDSGADDYLAKPFSFEELLARLRALARRPREVRMPVLTVGKLRLDPAARTVAYGDTPIELTRKEFALLEALMRRPGEAVSRFDLLECAWDDSYDNRSNIVDVYIGYLQAKGRSAVRHREHRDRTRLRLPAPHRGDRMSRLPIRWKLTLAFALALTVVLTAVGVFLARPAQHRRGRRHRARPPHARRPAQWSCSCGSRYRRCPPQLLSSWSRTKRSPRSSPRQAGWWLPRSYADVRLLTPSSCEMQPVRELFVDRPGDAMLDESLRIFAMPVHARGENFVVVVTDSLDERAQTLASTLGVEIVGLAAALIASCGVGYWVSGLALRPVEELRQRAAAISGDDLADAQRAPLPVSPVARRGRAARTHPERHARPNRTSAGRAA